MLLSQAEENYIKAIYKLTINNDKGTTTNDIAREVNTKASSVTDMLKKLKKKDVISYKPYNPISLTELGTERAIQIVRKQRLWEVFLYDKLGFKWDQVSELASELEHVQNNTLIDKLDTFLNSPTHTPHGNPIPDRYGRINNHEEVTVADLEVGQFGMIIGLKDTSSKFLQYLDKTGLNLGKTVKINQITDYDQSMEITLNMTETKNVTYQAAQNLYIKKLTR